MSQRVMYLDQEELASAAHAWDIGGSLALGAWAARNLPRFTAAEYGALVREVREYLCDDTDYSDADRRTRGTGEARP